MGRDAPTDRDWVGLTYAPNQPVAELIANILSEEGIDSYVRRAHGFDVPEFFGSGARMVMVRGSHLSEAQALLADLDTDGPQDDSGPNAR